MSKDENLNEEISVTVIATGFESNSIFQPYKPKKPRRLNYWQTKMQFRQQLSPEKGDDVFSVHEKGKKSIITDFEEESQGVIDFSLEHNQEMSEIRSRRSKENDENREKPEAT